LIQEGSVVGVVALAHAPAHTELLHLAIDASMQGRGVGSAAVGLLVAHVAETRPSSRRVELTVHPENARAQRLYRTRASCRSGRSATASRCGRGTSTASRCHIPRVGVRS
jgi:ribosomal protein S18 acetylase RimI-like enzyme